MSKEFDGNTCFFSVRKIDFHHIRQVAQALLDAIADTLAPLPSWQPPMSTPPPDWLQATEEGFAVNMAPVCGPGEDTDVAPSPTSVSWRTPRRGVQGAVAENFFLAQADRARKNFSAPPPSAAGEVWR